MDDRENELHKTHFSNLLSCLSQKTLPPDVRTIRNALLLKLNCIKNATSTTAARKSINFMCCHCFTPWKEGKFSVKFKPKNRSKIKLRKDASKRMIVKCSNCSHVEYTLYNAEKELFKVDRKTNKVSHHQKNTKSFRKPPKKSNNSKVNAKIQQNRRPKKKEANKSTKSNLTILKDLL